VERLAGTLGYDRSFAISNTGRSGGIGIFWNNDINIEILPYSQYHLDAVVSSINMEPWRLTCVYGEACVSERHKTWDMLKFIRSSSDLPWLCIGDFNEVLHRSEHNGVNERSNAQIAAFRETVDVCGLMDLGYTGVPWTFEKKVAGGSYCRTRLDRALASPSWSSRYPLAILKHLTAATSDHSPILLRFEGEREQNQAAARPFRYEVMWESHEAFNPILEQAWHAGGQGTTVGEIKGKLNHLSGDLKR
jgi:hypothetical protein